MTSYISEETGQPVVIECRFCRLLNGKHTPATHVAGQWEGGDNDVDPRWVPVCDDHLKGWHRAPCNEQQGHEGCLIPPESRLPVFDLAPDEPEFEIAVEFDEDEEPVFHLLCPVCLTVDNIVEEDTAVRWNHFGDEVRFDRDAGRVYVFAATGTGEYHTSGWLCEPGWSNRGGCGARLTAPEFFEIADWS